MCTKVADSYFPILCLYIFKTKTSLSIQANSTASKIKIKLSLAIALGYCKALLENIGFKIQTFSSNNHELAIRFYTNI